MLIKNRLILIHFFFCSLMYNINGQQSINARLFDFGIHRNPKDLFVPKACDLISAQDVQLILGLASQNVQIKSADNPGVVKVKSCFYKWEDPSTPHAGMLLQIMTNPVYDDSPEYVSDMMASKLADGETSPGAKNKAVFKETMIGKVKVIYAKENSRVYWNIGDNYLFMLAFNITNLDETKMLEMANKIVPIVNKNLLGELLK